MSHRTLLFCMIWVKHFKEQTSAESFLTISRVGSKANAEFKECLVTVQFPSEQLKNLPSHGHSARVTLNENYLIICEKSSGIKKQKKAIAFDIIKLWLLFLNQLPHVMSAFLKGASVRHNKKFF